MEGISAVALIILVIITFFYLLETRKMVKEMEKARKMQLRPHVVFEVVSNVESNKLLDIMVKNYGNGSAYGITFKFDPEVPYYGARDVYPQTNLSDLSLLKKINCLAPNEERRFFFDSFIGYEEAGKLMQFNVIVSYKDAFNEKFPEVFHIDLKERTQLLTVSTNNIRNEIEKIRKAVEQININLEKGSYKTSKV